MPTPLANRTYRRLFAAQVIALAGTGLSTVALALLAYDLAREDAGAVLGTALALKMVAYVGIAPVVGGLAHRLARKPLLIALDLLRAASTKWPAPRSTSTRSRPCSARSGSRIRSRNPR